MKTITIATIIDVAGALATNSLDGSIYLVDDNKRGGSELLGTPQLKTKVRKGDQLMWVIVPLEVEAYSTISHIDIDHKYIKPEQRYFPNSDVTYWIGIVKKVPDCLEYSLSFLLGDSNDAMTPDAKPALIN